jgi:tetratricopeptide (TPR) repeat protein
MNTYSRHALFALSLALLGACQGASADALSDDIDQLQHGWANAYYQTPDDRKDAVFSQLQNQARQISSKYAGRAEPLIWEAIITSTHAKFQGMMTAGKSAKAARDLLLAAEKIDANALDGSVYTSLGSLYYKVPGWPLSFGDKDKAQAYLQQALKLNPDGIDPNFFFAELLIERGEEDQAKVYLGKALAAPPRPGREDADAGRRVEIQALLDELDS